MGRITWHGAASKAQAADPLASHIGGQLLKQRQKHQQTMDVVVEGTGIAKTSICQIENGQRSPTSRTLWKLSKHFGVPIGYWFKGYED